MKSLFLIVCIVGIYHVPVIAQYSDFRFGARSQGMGNTSVANSDVWSIFNNIGTLANEKEAIIGTSYSLIQDVEGFKTVSICANLPQQHFNIGLGAYYFGDDIYNEGRFTVGASHKISFVSLGIALNYLQYNVIEFGHEDAWVLEIGGKVQIFPSLSFGAHIQNVNQAKLVRENKIPTLMKAGISFSPQSKTTLNVEIEKDPYYKTSIKTGLEYAVVNQFLIRTGFTTNPSAAHLGIGFLTNKLQIDYAISPNYKIGLAHHLSANIKLYKKNEGR